MLQNIYEQQSDSEYTVPNYHILYGEIDDKIVKDACEWIVEANLENSHPNLHLVINSVGGSLTSAWSLIDFMSTSRIAISTYGVGQTASAGLLLLMSGTKEHRFASQNLSIMSHQFEGGYEDSYHNISSMNIEYKNTHDRYLKHYIKCTGLSEKKVTNKLLSPTNKWMTSHEALLYNLIDNIFYV